MNCMKTPREWRVEMESRTDRKARWETQEYAVRERVTMLA